MKTREEVAELLASERAEEISHECGYAAPVFAVPLPNGGYKLVQGNCHHWDCPRCGQEVARQAYGRMMHGIKELTGPFYMLTLTARGGGYTAKESEENWLLWSNRLFTRMRDAARKTGQGWHYVTVTERQSRGHPHSHTIMTFCPDDCQRKQRYTWQTIDGVRAKQLLWYDDECTKAKLTIRSNWLSERIVSAGFGEVYDMSPVYTAEGAASYVAKYLFKAQQHTEWPPRWKRIRFSQSWPKLPKEKTDAIPLVGISDLLHFVEDNNATWNEKDVTLDSKIQYARGLSSVRDSGVLWSD